VYHSLSRTERDAIIREVDRQFREKTGVTRSLHPSSVRDRDLRASWLRIRDDVMEKQEIEEDMKFRRDMFVSDVVEIVLSDMEFMGWKQAVELLKTWSERPPSIKPRYSAPVTKVVTMDWLLGFPRVKDVYDAILKDRIWTNPKSLERI